MEEGIMTWQEAIKAAEAKLKDADEALRVTGKPSERRQLIRRKYAWKDVADAIRKALVEDQ